MCVKGLIIWKKGTQQAAGAEPPMLVMDVGVQSGILDMLVKAVKSRSPALFH